MSITNWLQGLGLKGASATALAAALTAYGSGFEDHFISDERELPALNLSADDLRELGVKIAHRGPLLEAIRGLAGVTPAATMIPPPSDEARARRDLIVRLVPVAISVGFIGRLAQMDWLKSGDFPNYAQWQEIARLAAALFAVVSGWEWYWRDVDRRPLNWAFRFFVDVAIVVFSMMFLFSSANEPMWFISWLVIFFLYIVWDIFCIIEYPRQYVPPSIPLATSKVSLAWGVYRRGFKNEGLDRGPVTNAVWFLYFVLLFGIIEILEHALPTKVPVAGQIFWTCAAFVAGVALVRWDAGYDAQNQPPGRQVVKGFTMRQRLFKVAVTLLIVFAVLGVLYGFLGHSLWA